MFQVDFSVYSLRFASLDCQSGTTSMAIADAE